VPILNTKEYRFEMANINPDGSGLVIGVLDSDNKDPDLA